jgi:Excalibur calcium-binding domain
VNVHSHLGARGRVARRAVAVLALAMASVAAVPGPLSATASPGSVPAATRAAAAATTKVSTKTLLSQLKVAGEHASGYQRSKFTLWTDADHDRCNTRAEVLIAEARTKPHRSASCALTAGMWVSPYDGKRFSSASKLDIDHLVPLAEAWQSGGYRWDAATRKAYANDLGYARSLVAVSAHANRSKGDKEPQTWLPAEGRCSYLTSWVAVKWRWKLTINPAERTFVRTKLAKCDWPKVTRPSRATVHTGTSTSTGTGTGSGTGDSGTGNDPRFSTCAEAKSHGYGPYTAGVDPEYAWYRDGDGDGVVCE